MPVCDIGSIDQCDTDDEGVELENVTDDWYDDEGNLIPWQKFLVTQEQDRMVNGSFVLNALILI